MSRRLGFVWLNLLLLAIVLLSVAIVRSGSSGPIVLPTMQPYPTEVTTPTPTPVATQTPRIVITHDVITSTRWPRICETPVPGQVCIVDPPLCEQSLATPGAVCIWFFQPGYYGQ